MKKFLALSLLLFLFAQSGGLLNLYSLQQKFVQWHMEEELNNPNAEFESIRMLRSEKGRKNVFEVMWKGRMYDVKNIFFFEDSVSMLALHDTKEETVLHEIEKLICHAEDHNRVLPDLLLKLSSLTYISGVDQTTYFVEQKSFANYPFYLSPTANLISQDVSSPPPEVV